MAAFDSAAIRAASETRGFYVDEINRSETNDTIG